MRFGGEPDALDGTEGLAHHRLVGAFGVVVEAATTAIPLARGGAGGPRGAAAGAVAAAAIRRAGAGQAGVGDVGGVGEGGAGLDVGEHHSRVGEAEALAAVQAIDAELDPITGRGAGGAGRGGVDDRGCARRQAAGQVDALQIEVAAQVAEGIIEYEVEGIGAVRRVAHRHRVGEPVARLHVAGGADRLADRDTRLADLHIGAAAGGAAGVAHRGGVLAGGAVGVTATVGDQGVELECDRVVDRVVAVAVGEGAEIPGEVGPGNRWREGAQSAADPGGEDRGRGGAVVQERQPAGEGIHQLEVGQVPLGHRDLQAVAHDLADRDVVAAGRALGGGDDRFADRGVAQCDRGVVAQLGAAGQIAGSAARNVGVVLQHPHIGEVAIHQAAGGIVIDAGIEADNGDVAAAAGVVAIDGPPADTVDIGGGRAGVTQADASRREDVGIVGGRAIRPGEAQRSATAINDPQAASGDGESGGQLVAKLNIEGTAVAGADVLDHDHKADAVARIQPRDVGIEGIVLDGTGGAVAAGHADAAAADGAGEGCSTKRGWEGDTAGVEARCVGGFLVAGEAVAAGDDDALADLQAGGQDFARYC